MEEEGALISGDELNSDIGGLKTEKNEKLKNQILIGAGIGLGLIFLIVLIIVLSSHSTGKSTKETFAELECSYDVTSTNEPTRILSNEFDNKFKMSIFIGDTEIKYSKTHQFSEIGRNKVRFVIHEDNISIDKMFRAVFDLSEAKFLSTRNIKIKSMDSLFENCIKLSYVQITGFNLSELKSLQKVFYHCLNLGKVENLDQLFSSTKITDMSYMFATTDIKTISLKNIDTLNQILKI